MSPILDTDTLISPTTAARRLGVHRSRIGQLIHSGELPATKIDGYWFLDAAAVEERAAGGAPAGRVSPQRPPRITARGRSRGPDKSRRRSNRDTDGRRRLSP